MLCRLISLYSSDIHNIYGSPDYAAEKLGWRSSFNGKTMMEQILEERLRMKSSGQAMPV